MQSVYVALIDPNSSNQQIPMLRRLPRLRRHDSQRCYSTAQASSLPIVSVAAFLDGSNATDRAKTDAVKCLTFHAPPPLT